jgi:hypothetical protein
MIQFDIGHGPFRGFQGLPDLFARIPEQGVINPVPDIQILANSFHQPDSIKPGLFNLAIGSRVDEMQFN